MKSAKPVKITVKPVIGYLRMLKSQTQRLPLAIVCIMAVGDEILAAAARLLTIRIRRLSLPLLLELRRRLLLLRLPAATIATALPIAGLTCASNVRCGVQV